MFSLKIPRTIIAGDRVTWRDSGLSGNDPVSGDFVTYQPGTHVLTYLLRGPSVLDVIAIADGDDFLSVINSVSSATLKSGLYTWTAAILTAATGDRLVLAAGQLTVSPNPAAITRATDARTPLQIQLDAVNLAITTLMQGGAVQSYEIRGRNLKRYNLDELMALRDQLKVEVSRESARVNGYSQDLKIKFSSGYKQYGRL